MADEGVGGGGDLAKGADHQPLYLPHRGKLPLDRPNGPIWSSTVCLVGGPCLGNITLMQLPSSDVDGLGRLLSFPTGSISGPAAAYHLYLMQAWDQVALHLNFALAEWPFILLSVCVSGIGDIRPNLHFL